MGSIKKSRIFLIVGMILCFGVGFVSNINEVSAAHTHTYKWVVVKQSTCTSAGLQEYTCQTCGHSLNGQVIPTKSHTWKLKSTTSPTCTADGKKTYKCANCTATKSETNGTKTGHNYTWIVMEKETCTQEGYRNYTCKNCGNTTNSQTLAVHPHGWNLISATSATCTADGVKTYKCNECGMTRTEKNGTKTGHNYVWVVMKNQTCTEDGYRNCTCTSCGNTTSSQTIPAHGHMWELAATISPTCTADGVKKYKCNACTATKTDENGKKTGHNYKKTLCDKPGECTICGDLDPNSVVTEHDWEIFTVNPTCYSNGKIEQQCKQCGYAPLGQEIPPYSHNLIFDASNSYESTIFIPGKKVYRCGNEGCTYTKEIILPVSSYKGEYKDLFDELTFQLNYMMPPVYDENGNIITSDNRECLVTREYFTQFLWPVMREKANLPNDKVYWNNAYTAWLREAYGYKGLENLWLGMDEFSGMLFYELINLDTTLAKAANQILYGNYADASDITITGTAGQIILSFAGVDFVADLRDIYYDFDHWELSWEHGGQTLLDVCAVFPVVGMLKMSDELAVLSKVAKIEPDDLVKGVVTKVDKLAATGMSKDEIFEEITNQWQKQYDELTDIPVDDTIKNGDEIVEGIGEIKLSENNIQHIKKHTFEGMAEQAKYLSDEQLANKLANTTFFNKNWSHDEVVKYTQEAYNILRNEGKTGLNSVEVNGEIINVYIKDDGTFDTAYGVYQYAVEDFR